MASLDELANRIRGFFQANVQPQVQQAVNRGFNSKLGNSQPINWGNVAQQATQRIQPIAQQVASNLSPTNFNTPVVGGIRRFNQQNFGTPSYVKAFDQNLPVQQQNAAIQDLALSFSPAGITKVSNKVGNVASKQLGDFLAEATKGPGQTTYGKIGNSEVGKGLGRVVADLSNATPAGLALPGIVKGVSKLGQASKGKIPTFAGKIAQAKQDIQRAIELRKAAPITAEFNSGVKTKADYDKYIGQVEAWISKKQLPRGSGGTTPVLTGNQGRNIAELGQTVVSKARIKTPITNTTLVTNALKGSIPSQEEIGIGLSRKLDDFINKTLDYSTAAPTGGTKGANLYTTALRSGQAKVTSAIENGLGSDNKVIRNASATLVGFFKNMGMSPERAAATSQLRGGMSVANQRAYDVMNTLYETVGKNKQSLERINAVLDPQLAKSKISYKQLSPVEKQVHDLIREGLDLVHDTSYANGHIAPEVYSANKGKYTPRLYEVYELPAEVSKFVTQGTKKLTTDIYKAKKGIDAWKMDNSLNDPVYALGKRLAQVETNQAIKRYTDFLAGRPNLTSMIERPGYTKLSESKAYGALSGKYVLNSAAEELKGSFFANAGLNSLYDAFKAYDRMGVRQLQKKLLTVFNPTTNVGNIVTDNVFGFMVGVDPLTLNKNILSMKQNPSQFKQLSDYLMRQGITGTDITRTDFVNKLSSIDALASDVGKVKTVASKLKGGMDKVQSFYGGTDDVYKVSAFKSLLDQGKSLEEATRLVADGFQNYANVGKFYDLYAKTPVFGQAFIKFQGDLMRIIKNAAVNRPLHLISFLGTLYGVARMASIASGEKDADRQARETRFGAPMIPGLNIPLTWQTPIGELNIARYISPLYANNTGEDQGLGLATKMLPGVPNLTFDSQGTLDPLKTIAKSAGDPLVGPLVQAVANKDFRGKPISDPNETKYQPSTLTTGEKASNVAQFLGRQYLPPVGNTALDIKDAAQGKPDRYGRTRNLPQALARAAGIKIEQYGPEQVQLQKERDLKYAAVGSTAITKNITTIKKELAEGKITPEIAQQRINQQLSQQRSMVPPSEALSGPGVEAQKTIIGNKIKNGQTLSPEEISTYLVPPTTPTLTGQTALDKQVTAKYNRTVTTTISKVTALAEQGILTPEEANRRILELQELKITEPKAIKSKKTTTKKSVIKGPKKAKVKKAKKISAPKVKLAKVAPIKIGKNTFKVTKAKTSKAPKFKAMKMKKLKLA